MLYSVVDEFPLNVFCEVVDVLSFSYVTLKPLIGLPPLEVGFVQVMKRLSSIRSVTIRLVGASGANTREGQGMQ